jgi:hypothetical protein
MGERPPGRLVPRPTGCGYPHVRLVMHVLNYAGTPQRGQTWRRAVKSSGRRTARRTRQADWKLTGRPASTGPQALQDRRLSEGHKSHERPGDSVGFHTACWVSAAYPNPNARDYVYTQDSPAIPRGGPDGSANCRRCAPDGTGRRMSRISKADEKALLAQLHDCLADFIEAAVADLREIAAIRKQAREHDVLAAVRPAGRRKAARSDGSRQAGRADHAGSPGAGSCFRSRRPARERRYRTGSRADCPRQRR